jgi:hypothetical protein
MYQNRAGDASLTPRVPTGVMVSLAEIGGSAKEGLLAVAVGAGLQVMSAMMDAEVEGLVGPRGAPAGPGRGAARRRGRVGHVGWAAVPVRRPRVRTADGDSEVPLGCYELFAGRQVLGAMALERMLAGLSARHYRRGLEPVGEQVAARAASTSRSAVSRRFVAATETALAELMSADLSTRDLVVLMVDGVHFAEHTCVVAPGIDGEGGKHPLALVEGSSENATLVTGLLTGLRERGLDVTRPILVVVDGSKALARAVREVFDKPLVQRCQEHKIRNVRDRLPEKLRSVVQRRMREAYHAESALAAEARLTALAAELDKTHPGAAASLREGLQETLTVLRLGVPPTLVRTLRSTNPIESLISICRDHSTNVKRWRDGQMALRWCAAGMGEAAVQFRRVNGHLHLRKLRDALERHFCETVTPVRHNQIKQAA